VERRGLPAVLGEPGHAFIGSDRDWRSQQLIQSVRPEITREAFDVRADNQLAQLAAVRAGLGIGGCQLGLARRDPDLVPVLPEAFGFDLEVWVAMHEDLKASLRMRLMFDHLAAGLAVYVRGSQRQ
jgi:DNA-binding transcriptional LysR family regulator